MSHQYMVNLNQPFKEAGMKSVIFGPSQKNRMLQQQVDGLSHNIEILTEENTSLKEKFKLIDSALNHKKIELQIRSEKYVKLEENYEEEKKKNSKLISQLREERKDHARKLQETEKIIQEDMNNKMEAVLDEAKFSNEQQTFLQQVILKKANAYEEAYNKVYNIVRLDAESYGKLREFDDSGISRLQHDTFTRLKEIRDELREKKRVAESREPPKRKERKSAEAKPLKPKFNPAPPHTPTEAEEAMGLNWGYTYYDVLNVQASASFEEIKKAYRKQALTWHADKQFVQNKSKEVMEEAFKLVGEAFEVLKDEELRAVYDDYLRSNSHKSFRPGMFFPGFKFGDPYKTFAGFESNKFCINKFISAVKDFNIGTIAEEENDVHDFEISNNVYQREDQFKKFVQKQVNREKQFLEYVENKHREELQKDQLKLLEEEELKFLEDRIGDYQREIRQLNKQKVKKSSNSFPDFIDNTDQRIKRKQKGKKSSNSFPDFIDNTDQRINRKEKVDYWEDY